MYVRVYIYMYVHGEKKKNKAPRPPRWSEITFPRGGIVSAIYQLRRRTIKQSGRVFVPPPFPRCIGGRSISMAGRNIRSISGSVERIFFSSYGVFLVAARAAFPLRLSFSPSLSRHLRSFFSADLRGSRTIDTSAVRSRLIDSWKCPCDV